VLGVSIAVHVFIRPFETKLENRLETLVLVSLATSYAVLATAPTSASWPYLWVGITPLFVVGLAIVLSMSGLVFRSVATALGRLGLVLGRESVREMQSMHVAAAAVVAQEGNHESLQRREEEEEPLLLVRRNRHQLVVQES
jgi:hypothetical protein